MTKAARKIARKTKQAGATRGSRMAGRSCIATAAFWTTTTKVHSNARRLQQCSSCILSLDTPYPPPPATTPSNGMQGKQNQTKNVAANAISDVGERKRLAAERVCRLVLCPPKVLPSVKRYSCLLSARSVNNENRSRGSA